MTCSHPLRWLSSAGLAFLASTAGIAEGQVADCARIEQVVLTTPAELMSAIGGEKVEEGARGTVYQTDFAIGEGFTCLLRDQGNTGFRLDCDHEFATNLEAIAYVDSFGACLTPHLNSLTVESQWFEDGFKPVAVSGDVLLSEERTLQKAPSKPYVTAGAKMYFAWKGEVDVGIWHRPR